MAAPSLPADPGGVPIVELPSKVFTVEQADRLLPSLEAILREMDHRSLRLREVLELIVDAEEYWGDRIADPDVAGRQKSREVLREREDVQGALPEDIERIGALCVVLK